jgi:adenylosuccinate lyase
MVPIVGELARKVGEPAGGWVHWGATTQNIEQTGDVVGLRDVLGIFEAQLCDLLEALASLAERGADMLMAGRTHWQHAVPITFGFKVAGWADVMMRHLERLDQLRPRLLISMTGGAVGNFASLGAIGPDVQAGVARRLGLKPMAVPMRNIADPFAELVLLLALIGASAGQIADEVSRLMGTDFGEVAEDLPEGDVGSSTMPQKRNAKQAAQVVIKSAEIRGLAPVALEAMIQSHEVDGPRFAIMDETVERGSILAGEMLEALLSVVSGLKLFPERMRANLDTSGGLIGAEAVMLSLGKTIGRQEAHEVVHHAAKSIATGETSKGFAELLAEDPHVSAHLSPDQIKVLLDPAQHTGLSSEIARAAALRARETARQHRTASR